MMVAPNRKWECEDRADGLREIGLRAELFENSQTESSVHASPLRIKKGREPLNGSDFRPEIKKPTNIHSTSAFRLKGLRCTAWKSVRAPSPFMVFRGALGG